MAIFKCKMCGGDLEVNETMSVGTCQYCGSVMTLPKLDNDRKANMYGRANHFRRNDEFDKAMNIYETILNEDPTDAEAYWSLVLCKYGIEYVEDPDTHKRIPTCNRTRLESVFADEDYKAAIKNADPNARVVYEAEAEAIDGIQKEIIRISSQEEPYDVFICYKETDNSGKRTQDSVLAQELYFELEEMGYKVFFSRITLEDKLGTSYEPYIFAALNSAKVMVVIGTKAEYVNSPWVKNEWSRYLTLIKQGDRKILIPAYRGMDPYDLPEEFSHLQAQDMSRLGFMQDLIRGIQKMLEEPAAERLKTEPAAGDLVNIESLLDRAFICLEDLDWNKADEVLERVLDQDPRCARAYIGKMMIELQIGTEDKIGKYENPISENGNYQKALRFADGTYRDIVSAYNQAIVDRIENERLDGIYKKAKETMEKGGQFNLRNAQVKFESIKGYLDSTELAVQCSEWAEEAEREEQEKWEQNKEIKKKEAEKRRIENERKAAEGKKAKRVFTLLVMIGCAIVIAVLTYLCKPAADEINDKIAELNLQELNLENAETIVELNEEIAKMNFISYLFVKNRIDLENLYQPAIDIIGNEETKDDPTRNLTEEDFKGEWKSINESDENIYIYEDDKWKQAYEYIYRYNSLKLGEYDYKEKVMTGTCLTENNQDCTFTIRYEEDSRLVIRFYQIGRGGLHKMTDEYWKFNEDSDHI